MGSNDNVDLTWVRIVGDFLPGLLLFQYSYFVTFYNHRSGESTPCPQKISFLFSFFLLLITEEGRASFQTGKRESSLKRLYHTSCIPVVLKTAGVKPGEEGNKNEQQQFPLIWSLAPFLPFS